MAYGELTRGMASTGHIFSRNHGVIRINGSASITIFYPIQGNRVGSLGPMAEPRPEQRPRNQWSAACQGTHERQNYPPPRGDVVSDQVATRTMPHVGKPRTRFQSHMVDKLPITP